MDEVALAFGRGFPFASLTRPVQILCAMRRTAHHPVWVFIPGLTVCVGLAWLMDWLDAGPEPSLHLCNWLRWIAMFLQISGLITVAWGLDKTRQIFGRSPLFPIEDFIKDKPDSSLAREKRPDVISEGTGFASGGSGAAAHTRASGAKELVKRVQQLEANFRAIDDKIRSIDARQQDLKKEIMDEHTQRVEGDEKNVRMLEETALGGINLEFVGLAFLLLGVIAGSLPCQ